MIGQEPSGWTRLDDGSTVPVWDHDAEPVRVATGDMDLLRFLGAALARFDRMDPREFAAFVKETGA